LPYLKGVFQNSWTHFKLDFIATDTFQIGFHCYGHISKWFS